MEATTTTRGATKPLLWERLRSSDRFRFVNQSKVSRVLRSSFVEFLLQVQHVVMDDVVEHSRIRAGEIWYHEHRQTQVISKLSDVSQELCYTSPLYVH